MIEIERPKIEIAEISENGTYGKFVVEPLERGFGTTLGNSLRRVLSACRRGCGSEGAAKFSTIPGVKDGCDEIIPTSREVAMFTDGPKMEISAEGPCVVTADSIKCDRREEISVVAGEPMTAAATCLSHPGKLMFFARASALSAPAAACWRNPRSRSR